MRKTILVLIFVVFISISVLSVESTSADGGGYMVVDYEEHIYLPEQKAAIFWDGTNETMVISTKIKSDYFSDIAWVIPIQSSSDPTVDIGDTNVFDLIANSFGEWVDTGGSMYSDFLFEICIFTLAIFFTFLILIIVAYIKKKITMLIAVLLILIILLSTGFIGAFFYIYSSGMVGSGGEYLDVELIEFKTVDIYDIAILKGTNATQLVGWLNENDFYVNESTIPVIQSYCDRDDFYFIVNRINLTNKYTTEEQIEGAITRLKKGVETPLEIKFQPEKPFYPMKMSSINEGDTKINVYFISNYTVRDEANYLIYEGAALDKYGASDLFLDKPRSYDYTAISMLTFEGNTSELDGDSYFIRRE